MFSTIQFSVRNSALIAVAAMFAVVGVSSASAAQRVCGERDKLNKFLATKYQELPRALGVGGSGKQVFEVYTSEKGTWTVLMTMTNGTSCIMAAGHSWKEEDKVAFLPKT